MKLLFILDPLRSLKTYKDTSFAMMVEAARRGHALTSRCRRALMWQGGRVIARALAACACIDAEKYLGQPGAARRRLVPRSSSPRTRRRSREFDAVLMRKDPPFDMEYVY